MIWCGLFFVLLMFFCVLFGFWLWEVDDVVSVRYILGLLLVFS